ncbi:MAG: hypothetical protein IT457_12270 [Planctomycetes bacterium]|nr:hypothetical protein [Planctomycetota bacterium]
MRSTLVALPVTVAACLIAWLLRSGDTEPPQTRRLESPLAPSAIFSRDPGPVPARRAEFEPAPDGPERGAARTPSQALPADAPARQGRDATTTSIETAASRRARVERELLEHIRAQWPREDFVRWVLANRPQTDDPAPRGLSAVDVELAHDCATWSMMRAFVPLVSELRTVEARQVEIATKGDRDAESRDRAARMLEFQDASANALFARLERLNADLAEGRVSLLLHGMGGPQQVSRATAHALVHNPWRKYTSCSFQSGPWRVALRIRDEHWDEPDRTKILAPAAVVFAAK